MEKKYYISAEGQAELKAAREANKDKNVENRLKALIMRSEGKKNKEIAVATEYHPAYVIPIFHENEDKKSI